jgi:hypothetical protein
MKYLMCFLCPPIACCMAGRVDKAVYQLIVALFAAVVLNVLSFFLFPVYIIWAWKVCTESDKIPQESRAAADMRLSLEAQHRQLLQATNPEAFKELIQREEAERVAKAKAREEQLSVQAEQSKTGVIIASIRPVFMRFTISALVILSAIGGLTNEAKAQAWHIKTACVGTKNKDDRGTVYDMIRSDDKASLAQMLEDGEVIFLEAGTVCYPVHNADFWTNWQIRVSGQPGLWWVSVEDLEHPGTASEQKDTAAAEATPSPTATVESSPTSEPSIVNSTPSSTPGTAATPAAMPTPTLSLNAGSWPNGRILNHPEHFTQTT